jgi:hypothetical protein
MYFVFIFLVVFTEKSFTLDNMHACMHELAELFVKLVAYNVSDWCMFILKKS